MIEYHRCNENVCVLTVKNLFLCVSIFCTCFQLYSADQNGVMTVLILDFDIKLHT